MRNYLTSVAVYGLIGTTLGLALGIVLGNLLVNYVSSVFTLDVGSFNPSPTLVPEAVAVGVGVPLAAAIVPVFVGTRVTVHQALSGYGVDGDSRGWRGLERPFAFLPETMQLGLRNLGRKWTRTLLSLLGLATAGACFLAVQNTAYAFNQVLDQLLSVYHADVFVDLSAPASGTRVSRVLAGMSGIAASEGDLHDDVQTQWGDGLATGLEPGGSVYQPHLLTGRWFTAGDTNVVVLSERAANTSGLKVGETLALHDDLHGARWTVIGIARDDNNGSLKMGVLLSPIAEVATLRHLPGDYVDGLFIRASSERTADVDTLATQIDDTLSRAGYQASRLLDQGRSAICSAAPGASHATRQARSFQGRFSGRHSSFRREWYDVSPMACEETSHSGGHGVARTAGLRACAAGKMLRNRPDSGQLGIQGSGHMSRANGVAITTDLRGRIGAQASMVRERMLAISSADWLAAGTALLVAALFDFIRLGQDGDGNLYYAAAVKSMLESWHNFFFVSFDPGGFVSIDKPPVDFWIQAASAKLFGLGGFSLALPQALAGIASVGVLYLLVRRIFGVMPAFLAALALAVSPIDVAANRDNIVDSMLVLVVLLAALAVMRAAETGRLRWLLLGAALVGLGFNVKMLEAYLVVPALGVLYALAAPGSRRARVLHLALAGALLLVVSLSWTTAVDLTPASQRPYVGSSSTNSELNLAFGYNGIDRLIGGLFGRRGGGTRPTTSRTSEPTQAQASNSSATSAARAREQGFGGVGETGAPGPLRLFNSALGNQVSWLLALALIGLLASGWGIRFRRRAQDVEGPEREPIEAKRRWRSILALPRPESTPALSRRVSAPVVVPRHAAAARRRAPSTASITGTQGITIRKTAVRNIHRPGPFGARRPVLVPAPVAAGSRWFAGGATSDGRPRLSPQQRACTLWGMWLLTTATFFSVAGFFHAYYMVMMAPAICALAGIGAVALWHDYRQPGWRGWLLPLALALTALTQMAFLHSAPASLGWVAPAIALAAFGAAVLLCLVRLARQTPEDGRHARAAFTANNPIEHAIQAWWNLAPRLRGAASAAGIVATVGMAALLLGPTAWAAATVAAPGNEMAPTAGPHPRSADGGFGGEVTATDPKLVQYLKAQQGKARYLFATLNATTAAPYVLATGQPVMAMGGFMGGDQILTLADLQRLIASGQVRYFLLPSNGRSFALSPELIAQLPPQMREMLEERDGFGGLGMFGGLSANAGLSSWVSGHCTVVPTSQWSSARGGASGQPSTNSGGFGGFPFGRNGRGGTGETLYDCAGR